MNKLRETREECGKTQEQMARSMKITPQRYSQMERNPERLRLDQMRKIGRILGKDPRVIFF